MLIVEQDASSEYGPRTEVNASKSDFTIAIAVDFKSRGEELTKALVKKHGKLYIPVSPTGNIDEKANKIVTLLNEKFASETGAKLTVNIAGNGIKTMDGKMTQDECDVFTFKLLSKIFLHKELKTKIGYLRSGGQTGFDEAGIKAGTRLRLKTTAYLPKGYRIRTLSQELYPSLKETLKRFYVPIVYIDMDGVLCDFVKAYLKMKREHPDITYPQSQFGFFNDLEPIKDAVNAYERLHDKYNVFILTRPSVYNLMCYTEKAYWVKKYLGFEILENLIMSPDKSLLKGDFLIDDHTDYGQTEFEGKLLLFGGKDFPEWEPILKYLGA